MPIKLCTVKGCPYEGHYCRLHLEKKPTNQRVITIIPKVSENRKELNKKYKKKSKEIKGDKTECMYKIPGVCTGKIQGYNHPAGKHNEERMLDIKPEHFCCNACNTWLEAHHAEAVKKGYIKKRNTKLNRGVKTVD